MLARSFVEKRARSLYDGVSNDWEDYNGFRRERICSRADKQIRFCLNPL